MVCVPFSATKQKNMVTRHFAGGTRESCRTILGGGQSETGEGPPPQPEDEAEKLT